MDESLNKKGIHFTQNRNKKIKGYNLFRNYPNPFNPSTTIPFEIQRGGYTTLEVYSTLGQKISTLLNGIKESGYYEVTIDANKLPSGIYFYKLQTADFVQTRKMILIK